MPRPAPTQVVSGSATTLLSVVAMLLLSNARSGAAVALIAAVGLALGVLVSLALAAPARTAARPVGGPPGPRRSGAARVLSGQATRR